MSLYKDFLTSVNKNLLRFIDKDKKYGNMCVDFVKQYAEDIGYPITTFGNATDFIKGLGPNWIRVEKGQTADIGIFPKRYGLPYGHIFVVDSIVGNKITVIEQNRDGKAYANNNPKNLGSPVNYGTYNLNGEEVYFRPVGKKMKAKPFIRKDIPEMPILNQGLHGECAGFAILGALMRMNPKIDYIRIQKELISETGNEGSITRALAWFQKKGYIKGYSYKAWTPVLLEKGYPIITGASSVDWATTTKTKILTFGDTPNSHYFFCDSYNKDTKEWQFVNSWGNKWGNKGKFTYSGSMRKLKRPLVLEV